MKTSLDKHKIKIVLLEGVHVSAVGALRADGYTNVEHHAGALSGEKLREAARDAYFLGIRSATHLDADFSRARRG
jgi:D-3-phosphoglycerate dehydrogenase